MPQRVSRRLILIFLLLMPWLGGCKKKTSEWLDELRLQYEPLRARLRQIAAELPPASAAMREIKAAGLNPKPVLHINYPDGNLVFLHARQLTDPMVKIDEQQEMELPLGGGLLNVLAILAQPSLESADYLAEPRPKSYLVELRGRIDPIRYLGVYRSIEHEAPVSEDGKTFRGGKVVLAFFIYDLKDGKLLAQWTNSALPDDNARFYVRGGEYSVKNAAAAASFTLKAILQKELVNALPDRIGAAMVR